MKRKQPLSPSRHPNIAPEEVDSSDLSASTKLRSTGSPKSDATEVENIFLVNQINNDNNNNNNNFRQSSSRRVVAVPRVPAPNFRELAELLPIRVIGYRFIEQNKYDKVEVNSKVDFQNTPHITINGKKGFVELVAAITFALNSRFGIPTHIDKSSIEALAAKLKELQFFKSVNAINKLEAIDSLEKYFLEDKVAIVTTARGASLGSFGWSRDSILFVTTPIKNYFLPRVAEVVVRQPEFANANNNNNNNNVVQIPIQLNPALIEVPENIKNLLQNLPVRFFVYNAGPFGLTPDIPPFNNVNFKNTNHIEIHKKDGFERFVKSCIHLLASALFPESNQTTVRMIVFSTTINPSTQKEEPCSRQTWENLNRVLVSGELTTFFSELSKDIKLRTNILNLVEDYLNTVRVQYNIPLASIGWNKAQISESIERG